MGGPDTFRDLREKRPGGGVARCLGRRSGVVSFTGVGAQAPIAARLGLPA